MLQSALKWMTVTWTVNFPILLKLNLCYGEGPNDNEKLRNVPVPDLPHTPDSDMDLDLEDEDGDGHHGFEEDVDQECNNIIEEYFPEPDAMCVQLNELIHAGLIDTERQDML